MFRPDLPARVEEQTEVSRLWIEGAEIAAFVAVATPTGERQILKLSLAAVLFGDNVIDFVWEEGHACRK